MHFTYMIFDIGRINNGLQTLLASFRWHFQCYSSFQFWVFFQLLVEKVTFAMWCSLNDLVYVVLTAMYFSSHHIVALDYFRVQLCAQLFSGWNITIICIQYMSMTQEKCTHVLPFWKVMSLYSTIEICTLTYL